MMDPNLHQPSVSSRRTSFPPYTVQYFVDKDILDENNNVENLSARAIESEPVEYRARILGNSHLLFSRELKHLDARYFGLVIDISGMRNGGLGGFVARDLYRGETVRYFIGTIVREDFSEHDTEITQNL